MKKIRLLLENIVCIHNHQNESMTLFNPDALLLPPSPKQEKKNNNNNKQENKRGLTSKAA